MVIIDRATVEELVPMDAAIGVMREAFARYHAGEVYQPLRSVLQPPGIPGVAIVKPAAVAGRERLLGMKIVTEFKGNAGRGLDAIQGAVLLLDTDTGVPCALVDAGAITAIRTAAVSGLATDLLARREPAELAILGAGVQARSHIAAMVAVRPITAIRVWNRTPERAEALVTWAVGAGMAVDVSIAATPAEAANGAGIICTVTASPRPVLPAGSVREGAHINAVGAYRPETREVDSAVVAAAEVFVDSRESAMAEAGDLLIPIGEGLLGRDAAITAELGEVVAGFHPGRTSATQITLFKSLGLAFEDVETAGYVVRRAVEAGAGLQVPFP